MHFRELLAEWLKKRPEWSLRDYSSALGHQSPGLVAHVLSGKRPLPLDELDAWAKPFEPLEAFERDQFYELAILDYAPRPLRDLWHRVQAAERTVAERDREIEVLKGRLRHSTG